MKHLSQLLLLLSILLCCEPANKPMVVAQVTKKGVSFSAIRIVPLGKVDTQYLDIVAKGIKRFYGITPTFEKSIPLTKDLFAPSKTRYEANKILTKFQSERFTLILTEKDIAVKYKPQHSNEWGILGLSHCPGRTAVVSTFRIKGSGEHSFAERLQKICIHELGHSIGLSHCQSPANCLMKDAKGTIKQIDKADMQFCKSCRTKLND